MKMKLFCALLVVCAISADLIEGTFYTTYRVRRSGTKGSQQGGQYIQQEETYDSGAALGGSRSVRPLPSRPRQPARQRQQEDQYAYTENQVGGGQADAEPPSYGGVAGLPGKDFPAYGQIPHTSFSCSQVPYEPGMYADEETQCQAYHVCFQGRKESFLCGVGTVFNQAILACDYWHSVECSRTKEFYSANEELGKAGAEPGQGGQSAQAASQSQSQSQSKWSQQKRTQRPQQSARQQYQSGSQSQYSQSAGQYQPEQYPGQSGQYQPEQYPGQSGQPRTQYSQQQQRPRYQPKQQFGGAQVYGSQQQYSRKSVRPQTQPQAEYEEVHVTYEAQPQYQVHSQGAPGPKFQKPQTTSVKANVQYGGQQTATHVESVSEEIVPANVVEYVEHDQAAVRSQLVVPGPRPQFVQPQGPRPQPQRVQPSKSKYHDGGNNQQSPSYRSKALSQVQQPQYPQEEEQPSYQQVPQKRPVSPQPQRRVDPFRDTQQKLNY